MSEGGSIVVRINRSSFDKAEQSRQAWIKHASSGKKQLDVLVQSRPGWFSLLVNMGLEAFAKEYGEPKP